MEDILNYLNDLRNIPRISISELETTIELYKFTESVELRNKIITYYLPIIPQLLLRYVNQGIDTADLLQIANEKLIEVITGIPSHDIKDLRGYIITSINNAIILSLQNTNRYNSLIKELQTL